MGGAACKWLVEIAGVLTVYTSGRCWLLNWICVCMYVVKIACCNGSFYEAVDCLSRVYEAVLDVL